MKYHRKSKAQRKRDRLERLHKKQVTADMKLEYEKFISENPHLKGNSPKKQLQRQLQKQRIKREYAKARRVGAEAKTAKETFTKTANAVTGIAKKLQEIATKNKTLIITVGIFALLLIMIMSALSSCGSMFTGTVTTTMASTYLSLPAEIDAADLSFTEKEMELQNKIDRIETDYPGYDEYVYNLGAIGHDPYTLISYLSAVHTEFTAAGIESEIQELFDAMYSLTTEEVEETRTRTVTKTGTRIVTNPDGTTSTEEYEYEEEEEYTVRNHHIISIIGIVSCFCYRSIMCRIYKRSCRHRYIHTPVKLLGSGVWIFPVAIITADIVIPVIINRDCKEVTGNCHEK
jgi:hypothetical protein